MMRRLAGTGAIIIFMTLVMLSPGMGLANPQYSSLVIDADTGVVLHEEHAGEGRYPASLTKMMTLYMAFQALEKRKLRMGSLLKISSRAAGQPPSRLGLRRGDQIKLRDAIMAMVIKSANDAAVVVAEAIGGSEWQFASMMNHMAKKLGMTDTHFVNASGLHNRRQKTTAYDMARLAVALRRDFPQYYHLFKRTQFFYKGRTYRTHNHVVRKYRGADGLKTGYVRAAGYNLVTSAKREQQSLVGVVMGGRSVKRRDRQMIRLLDRGFYDVQKSKLASRQHANRPRPAFKPEIMALNKVAVIPKPELRPVEKGGAELLPYQSQLAAQEETDQQRLPMSRRSTKVYFRGKPVPLPQLKPIV